MDDNSDGSAADGGLDANSITSISNLHVKSLGDLARLSGHLPISWPDLPRMPFFGPLLGFNDQWYRAAIALSVLETRWRGNRSLTPEEVQVVAGQTAKAVATMAYEVPVLFGTTWLYERRGRATFRFPFFQPGASFNPGVFPSARWPALQGTAARSMWHLARVCLYTSLSHFALRTLFISYAMAVKNVEFERDPRLGSLRAAIRDHMADRLASREQQLHPTRGSPGLPLPPPGHSTQPLAHPRETDSSAFISTSNTPTPAPVQPYDDLSDETDNFAADTHDEASPVAPIARHRGWKRDVRPDDGANSGSAWDRVRNQASSGEPRPVPVAHSWGASRRATPQPAAASQKPTDDDRFSEFSVEKPTERQIEQKEFDAMLERERQGQGDERRRP
ncbi:hypothetical protein CMQ_6220 [Grosmannia clavigera kw1407]|uniref:Uncharacterized protein n=1 Tax=Grosmannia clavigera (strain kw1407 / UAMH 11150) TaxID=655863 RepID=F0XML6_GROCL|nr:uncharacterized protein CMQ_6220 [Grosmannia clavigera kw1407]EFX01278.1 hypothetical protein CMQ_6220 [Grosmannia clavigera kw1407]